jgi:Amino acid synthesis
MPAIIRKTVKFTETTFIEGGRQASPPVLMVAVAAVIANPWAGKGFVEDLRPAILEAAPGLADVLVPMLLDELGGGTRLEAYGKAAVVGLNGEIEHASGFIHTLRFGNRFREAVGGTSYLAFTNKRGPAGCSIQIPLMHKTDEGFRSHYLTAEFAIADAPGPDEIVVALGGAATGRAHPRIGNRYIDMEEMAKEPDAARR